MASREAISQIAIEGLVGWLLARPGFAEPPLPDARKFPGRNADSAGIESSKQLSMDAQPRGEW
jgi:hypothetical protein